MAASRAQLRSLGVHAAIGLLAAIVTGVVAPPSAQAVGAHHHHQVPGTACQRVGKVAKTAKYGKLRCSRVDGRRIWRYRASSGFRRLRVGTGSRSYLLHIPRVVNPAIPLVIGMHGNPSNPAEQAAITGYNATSEAGGFLLVYPAGAYNGSWADGRGTTQADRHGVNDVGFIQTLITSLETKYGVNPRRIYVSGYSNGAFMAARLACEIPGRIAAITAVAGTLPTTATCNPTRAVSVLQIHGTADPFVPYNGGLVGEANGGSRVVSSAAFTARWRAIDQCQPTTTTTMLPTNGDGTSVTIRAAVGCRRGTSVISYTVNNGGHTWPGGHGGPPYLHPNVFGKTSTRFSASSLSWAFFASHLRN